jgi:predicted alpha/beta hydrolase
MERPHKLRELAVWYREFAERAGKRPFGILASEWRKILNSKLNALSALTV